MCSTGCSNGEDGLLIKLQDTSAVNVTDDNLDLDGRVYLCEQTLKMTSIREMKPLTPIDLMGNISRASTLPTSIATGTTSLQTVEDQQDSQNGNTIKTEDIRDKWAGTSGLEMPGPSLLMWELDAGATSTTVFAASIRNWFISSPEPLGSQDYGGHPIPPPQYPPHNPHMGYHHQGPPPPMAGPPMFPPRPRMDPTSDVFTCLFGDLFVKCFEDSNSNGYSDSMASMANPYRQMDMRGEFGSTELLHKSRKNKEDKYCGVCGDRALGYNFDAISCESCKAFFRRNAPKGLDYFKCPYEDKCKMDVSNRRFCKRCRLRKCFEIGMRKEYILTEEEKMRKRQRIDDNRRMRDLEKRMQQSGVVTTSQMAPGTRLRQLEPEEEAIITEIVSAYRQSLEIPIESKVPRESPNMMDLVNIAEVSVRRVVDMAKKLKAFKALSQTDQIGLLKGGSIELLILRSVISFDRENNRFLDQFDKDTCAMSPDQLRVGIEKPFHPTPSSGSPLAGGGLNPFGMTSEMMGDGKNSDLFDEHMKFVKSLAVDLKADETSLILLLMLSLFSPDRPHVQDKTYVSAEQDKYALLLQRYLESKYPAHVVKATYPKLLMKLTDIRNLNEEHSQVLLKLNPEGIQPLMKEVMDMHLCKGSTSDSDSQSSASSP